MLARVMKPAPRTIAARNTPRETLDHHRMALLRSRRQKGPPAGDDFVLRVSLRDASDEPKPKPRPEDRHVDIAEPVASDGRADAVRLGPEPTKEERGEEHGEAADVGHAEKMAEREDGSADEQAPAERRAPEP